MTISVVQTIMADIYSNVQNVLGSQSKTFSEELGIDAANRREFSEVMMGKYFDNPTVVVTPVENQSELQDDRTFSDDSKSMCYDSTVKTEESCLPSFTCTLRDKAVPRMFNMDIDVEDDQKGFLEEDEFINSSVSDENLYKTEVPGKIFKVDSAVTEPPAGLQKKQNGNWCCDICGHEEILKDDLLTHRILHLSDDHSKQCPICEKKFSSLTSLRNHLTVHTGIKKFNCKYCGRKFGWKTQLAIHENLHTGKGLHHCQVCSKSFMTKWLLQRHLKIHLKGARRGGSKLQGSNRLSGASCGRGDSKNIPNHDNMVGSTFSKIEVSLTNENEVAKEVKCEECDLKFSGQETLAYHLLEHNVERQSFASNHNISEQEKTWNISLENWTTSNSGIEEGTCNMEDLDQDKLRLLNNKGNSKGSLTSIVSKLHNRVDEKNKSDDSPESTIQKSSEDLSYSKDSGVGNLTHGDPKLESSKHSSSSSFSDAFDNTTEDSVASFSNNIPRKDTEENSKVVLSYSQNPALLPNDPSNEEMRLIFAKQDKELSSLHSLVSTLNSKVDNLTNIVTSQSLLISRMFLGGKMEVNGNLDFSVRPPTNSE